VYFTAVCMCLYGVVVNCFYKVVIFCVCLLMTIVFVVWLLAARVHLSSFHLIFISRSLLAS
jgi:hypothetical protein